MEVGGPAYCCAARETVLLASLIMNHRTGQSSRDALEDLTRRS